MKKYIKSVAVEIKSFNDTMFISDADANKIINHKSRTQRGKRMSKSKLVNTNNSIKINGSLFFELTHKFDDCYFNNYMSDATTV